jgi:hypothetical protein
LYVPSQEFEAQVSPSAALTLVAPSQINKKAKSKMEKEIIVVFNVFVIVSPSVCNVSIEILCFAFKV